MAILVTGGTGYIGSVTVERLRASGEQVVVLDDLARGHRAALDADVPFYRGCVGDRDLVARIAKEHNLESCIHFAALAFVGESVAEPAKYYENNVAQGVAFFNALLEARVRRVVFSSTCATYGIPQQVPIPETCPQWPVNPYGWSKLFLERILAGYDVAYGMKFVALRYFNAAGATENRGEHHEPESHLVPNVLAAALAKKTHVPIFGTDYPTPDGTLGTGDGYSVLQVVECARGVTGHSIPTRIEAPRPGDPPRLVADAAKARRVLGWRPKHSGLASILRSQWEWSKKFPRGYPCD